MTTSDHNRLYLFALKDIHTLLSKHASFEVARFLGQDEVTSLLTRHVYDDVLSYFNIEVDFRRIVLGLHRVAEEYPESPWPRAMQARALIPYGHYGSAIREFEVAARMAPECALINIFCGEAYYYLAGREDPEAALDRYMSGVCYLTDAIMMDAGNPRPYLCRAHCQAHVIKLCKYPRDSGRFKIYYDKIQGDLMAAKRNSALTSLAAIDVVAKDIQAILGIESTQHITDS